MTYPTLGDITGDMITESGVVDGSSVQNYTEPQAIQAVNRMFNFLWYKQKWDHLWDWQLATLDGTTGKFSSTLTGVSQYEDIAEINLDTADGYAVPRSTGTQHLFVSGSDALYYTVLPRDDADADTKFFKFWPITATGTVAMFCGHRPAEFADPADIVPFDRHVITLGALWYLLASDGLNPAASVKSQGMFDTAFQDYVARYGTRKIGQGHGARNPNVVRIS